MDHEFWHERWNNGQIAFHQHQPNETLQTIWPTLDLHATANVFVPLCGKSLDMLWLRQQGHHVTGVELSQLAVDALFQENNLERATERKGQFNISRSDGIEIWCGDFFALPNDLIANADVLFDRGALVALPAEVRPRYAAHLMKLLAPTRRMLLLTVEYNQQEMGGPPFSVTKDMVTDYYGSGFKIEQVTYQPVEDIPERFRERGLTAMADAAYILTRKPQ